MNQRIREIVHFSKSAMFTIVVHGILIAALLAGLWWPYSENKAKRGSVKPIQAQVISAQEITKQEDQQKKKLEDKKKAEEELEKLKLKQEEEKKKLEQLEVERKKKEIEKQEQKEQQKREEKKKKEEALKKEQAEKKKREAEKQKKAEEKKKKEEALKKEQAEKKKREEKKKKAEQEKKRKEAEERKKAEDALKKQLEAEQASRVRTEAANAMSALVDRIAAAVENNWRRPLNSRSGLKATIRVKVSRNGDVLSANVVKSSGDSFFDQSAELAVKKASPLPFPADPKYYEHINEFDLLFNPDDF
jgi:colicin import membrane protein